MIRISTYLLLASIIILSCEAPVKNYETVIIEEDSVMGVKNAERIQKEIPLEMAEGINVTLWASDSLAPDPVAMSIDDYGSVFLTRTNRQKNSEFDIRGHMDWVSRTIALQTVEDRRNFLRNDAFATERSSENTWLPDLNNDSIHDWRDLAVEKEEIWKIQDLDGNGIADRSTRVLNDFNDEITDVAGALLVRKNDAFVGVGPNMWRVFDKDKNGVFDEKTSIAAGFNVHIGFSGHGMSGAVEGPDGKIYWGIGDPGLNYTTPDGREFKYPNQGVLVRSNPDGSDFEVYAAGLRNVHEFTFDHYGNIIGVDNDGDHRGESERLVYIVDGHDAGWRINWQIGKYTDPKNNTYKPWMDEKLFIPRHEGQAAYILPPLKNFHNGPTGMIHNPGTALGSKWQNKFFVVEFVGTPSRSPIWAFDLKSKGASFELNQDEVLVKGILPTGIRFGPDGALYAADWINGWGTKNYGRVWKVDVTEEENDLQSQREETQRLMVLDYAKVDGDDLYEYLSYPDMRIRLKSQFELVTRGQEGKEVLLKSANENKNQFGKIHGIWGLGQMIAAGELEGGILRTFLDDSDPEIITQTLKVIGDVAFNGASDKVVSTVSHESSRVKFFAAQAIGRTQDESGAEAIIQMLEENDDEDNYLRHAGVVALARVGAANQVLALKDHPKESMRIAAVLVLRRLGNSSVSQFLTDKSEYVVTEAARAINDDWSIVEGLSALAQVLNNDRFSAEPLIRRAINAAYRVGGTGEIEMLTNYAVSAKDPAMRAEALLALGAFVDPSVFDRVDNRYREMAVRDGAPVVKAITPKLDQLLMDEPIVVNATSMLISKLDMGDYANKLAALSTNSGNAEIRSTAIDALSFMTFTDFRNVVQQALKDREESVRATGLSYLDRFELAGNELASFVDPIFEKGTIKEQQELMKVLSKMPLENTSEVLAILADRWINGEIQKAVSLDFLETIDNSGSDELIAKVEPHRKADNLLEEYADALEGGDIGAGRGMFFYNSTAQCIRCHSFENEKGSVGPSLRGVASRLTKEQILESIIDPSAELALGFGSVVLTLKDGSTASGILMEENTDHLLLKTGDAEPLEIAIGRIEDRQDLPSSMLPFKDILTKRQIRNLVAFLGTLED